MLIPKAEQRIGQYLTYLERNAYRKISDLKFELFETGETYRLPPENAEWVKIKTPAPWGSEWKCAWFRAVYNAPSSDIPHFLSVTPNADSLAFIDSKPAGAFNIYHNKIRIDADGREHTLHIEAYSGHRFGGCGPLDSISIFVNAGGKNLHAFPNTFEGGALLERRPQIYSLFYDVRALFETAMTADANSLRRARILQGLCDALNIIGFNVRANELDKQAADAAQRLAPLLSLKNSPSTPSVHLIGHAHIDHAWLWPVNETKRKLARTFINMTRFAKEYPEFIFIQSQPCQLEIVKNEYPDVFTAVKDAYKNGNWEPNGGMWVEADCNIPSGESLIRQFLVGKKVNRELLNYEADTLWLPDVFGYAAALPQIMKGCRIKYFVTSKINWNDTTRFPYETFIWRGIDGTGIKTHFLSTFGPGQGYNGKAVPEELAGIWNSVQHKEVQSACVKPIGEGDGGGGTMRADLEMARRLGDLEGSPRSAWKTVSSALDEIFSGGIFPEWRGELYLELHRGTYTSQSRTKRNNRLLEFALRNAEFLCAFAALKGAEYPHEALLDCWKGTLTNQFHDIIPGSSIAKVYLHAEAESQKMLASLAQMSEEAKKSLIQSAPGDVFIFNDLSWEREDEICLEENHADIAALRGEDGSVHILQKYMELDGHNHAAFTAKIPPLGWAKFVPVNGTIPINGTQNGNVKSPFVWQDKTLETPFYKIKFDKAGRIVSLFDLRLKREMVSPGGAFNAFLTAEDVPVYWDAWDIEADWEKHSRQETELISMEAASDGPVCFRIRFAYEVGNASMLMQDMICYANDPRIEFETKVSWQEKQRLLKVEFDTAIDAMQVRCEVQYGHIWRNTHRNTMQDRAKFEICAHKWISLEEEGGGIALLNDCKYGHDVEGGRMRLTLLRSPIAPDATADHGTHRFTYAIMPFAGTFGSSGVIRSAYELNSPMTAFFATEANGGSNSSASLCSVDGNSVIIECVKAPENGGANELTMRLYESLGGHCGTTLRFSRELKAASETDMLEDNPAPLQAQGKNLALEFRPFEIKTVRVCF
ncbi:MAG: glycosyl hydrolase-related protein [Treponema sp.]|jgi:alpha-mannosidase|nr:glycosyl hydrolase-related protein [Treponema sp.]